MASRVVTTMKVVRRPWMSRLTAFERSTKPVVHGLEEQEELGDVLEELAAQDAIGHLVEGPAGQGQHLRPARCGEPAQEPAGEELGHAVRRLEEVEGVAGGGRVHHDQVVDAGAVDLVQALHGDVLVAGREPPGDVQVERVLQDARHRRRVGGVAADEVVPGLLGVEHRRPQLAPGLHAGRLHHRVGDAHLGVAELLHAEGVGQPAGGVDGEDQHLAAQRHRGHRRGGGRGGGLAHAAGAAADGHLLGRQQLLERQRHDAHSFWLHLTAHIRPVTAARTMGVSSPARR